MQKALIRKNAIEQVTPREINRVRTIFQAGIPSDALSLP